MRTKSDDRIRNRLIRSLGIVEEIPAALRKKCSSNDGILGETTKYHRNILTGPTLEIPLKNHCGLSNETEGSPHSRIQFNSVVQMKPIPSHTDYSDRVKKHLWSNRHEIRRNSQRNLQEFAFEGWNVHQVIEEDAMFFDKLAMEFVHPAHIGGGVYW
mmetsp:Transcript_18686/g.32918  ORF Transcript_18686/g.32918 Transcript_18686/m.32918 type:complete len:157 (-) Transcript_18686:303-773(-)